jgi:multiple sugar transport system substrate-binding protein
MQRLVPVLLASAFALASSPALAADLVVWWQGGSYAQEDEALEEIIAAFEQQSGQDVELVFVDENDLPPKVEAALAAGQPPDFAYGFWFAQYIADWAANGQLVDLSDAIGHFSDLFDPDALNQAMLPNAQTGRKALYGLPIGRSTNHLHVWKSLLEQAGFTLTDIPHEWEAFWSFWCEEVQPAVRSALGRDDIWGIGVPMSIEAYETWLNLRQFMIVYDADYVTPEGRLVIDDPSIRQQLVKAVDSYTAIHRRGCTPPEAASWGPLDNNEQFRARTVVMTPNETLSTVNALKHERPDDYYKNTATIGWPRGRHGEAFAIGGNVFPAVVFKDGANAATALAFVRFLVADGWLMHYLDFSAERLLPTIAELLDQPFWLDPRDPHRMAAVMQVASHPLAHNYAAASGDLRHDRVEQERVWAKAIHRVVTENISPEQAVDEAIARVKETLEE